MTTEYEFVSLGDDPDPSTPPFRSLGFVDDPLGILIVESCNGLFLCCNRCPGSETRKRFYYIYNPTTKQFSVLDPPANADFSSYLATVRLAFDPSKSIHYKLVMFTRDGWSENSNVSVHIYSSENRIWRSCENPFQWWGSFIGICKGVFWNGSFHWVTKTEGSICFDVDSECERLMPSLPPPKGWDESVIRHLGDSGGRLHLVDVQGLRIREISVYELEKDYSQWLPIYHIDLNKLLVAYPSMISEYYFANLPNYYNFCLVNLVRGETKEGDDKSSLILRVPGELISYDFSDGSIKQIHNSLPGDIEQHSLEFVRCFYGHLFLETLVSV